MTTINSSKISGNQSAYLSQYNSVSRVSRHFPETVRDTKKLSIKALNFYRKICGKTFSAPNNNFIMCLKYDFLNFYIDNYSLKELPSMSRVISCFYYFKNIFISLSDPNKISRQDGVEDDKKNKKEKKIINPKLERANKLGILIIGIAKHIKYTKKLTHLKITNIDFNSDLSNALKDGIKGNKSLTHFTFNNCTFTNESYEILMNGILSHEKIENLNMSNNKLDDRCGTMISRLISRQSQRRDQVIWMYGLRNEKPLNNEFAKGLVSIDFSNNSLSDSTSESIVYSLSGDNYIKKINFSNNNISELGCKKFCSLLKTNDSLINVDLRGNKGYTENVHYKIAIRLSNNIKKFSQAGAEEFSEFKKYVDFAFFKAEFSEESKILINSN